MFATSLELWTFLRTSAAFPVSRLRECTLGGRWESTESVFETSCYSYKRSKLERPLVRLMLFTSFRRGFAWPHFPQNARTWLDPALLGVVK